MNIEDIKKQFDALEANVAEKMLKRVEEVSEKWNESSRTEQKELVENFQKEFATVREEMQKMQEQVDAFEVKAKRGDFGEKKGRLMSIAEALKESEAIKHLKDRQRGDFQLKGIAEIMSTKADDMTQANSFESTTVVGPDYVPGIFYDPTTPFRVRTLMPNLTTTSNSVNVVREYAYSDATDTTSEGSEYKQSDFDLKMTAATVYKITAYLLLSEELLEDVEGLSGYIYSRLPGKLGVKENNKLLYGTGSSDISGLSVNATAYSDNIADSNVQLIDVLADAVRQVKDDEYDPSAILLHPSDATKYLTLEKDSQGRYMAPWVYTDANISIAGVPVIQTTAITAGTFFVGDFRRAAAVYDRRQNMVEITNTNEDNFIKGMMTVRAHERLALAIYRPSAFLYGSIAAALAQGSA